MKAQLTLDKAGRVVLPKSIRDALGLSAGDTLTLKQKGENIILHRSCSSAFLQKKKGIWVLHNAKPMATGTASALKQIREDRDVRNLRLMD